MAGRLTAAPRSLYGVTLLIDRVLPLYDAARVEHRIVGGDQQTVYSAVRTADFVRAWRESPAVRALFAARTFGERAVAALGGRPAPPAPEAPASMRLADMPDTGEWVLLGEEPPDEIAFGAAGRFWAGETVWDRISAGEFSTYAQPGRAKIASSFSLRPYGEARVLVSYECRTQATDDPSRRAFMRYWRALSPFIGVVLRSQLRVIDERAQELRAGAA